MILNTSISPRRDGTVVARGRAGNEYVFRADQDGLLACEVGDQADAVALLETGMFYPADEADFQAALALTEGHLGDDSVDDDGDDGDEGDGDDGNDTALPLEANTPPAPARARKARSK